MGADADSDAASPQKVIVVRHGEQLMKIFCSVDDEGTNSPLVSVAKWPPAPACACSAPVMLFCKTTNAPQMLRNVSSLARQRGLGDLGLGFATLQKLLETSKGLSSKQLL